MYLNALLLSLLAGLATGIGSLLAFFTRRTNTTFLSFSLGFSAGVMLYISFVEILSESRVLCAGAFGPRGGELATGLAFFGGVALIAIIDRLIPSYENPHELRSDADMEKFKECSRPGGDAQAADCVDPRLARVGIVVALAITIHNIPEGLATFTSALANMKLGISIAVAIGIHNIIEGITVSVPLFYATNDRMRAFKYSFLSGFAEPLGALLGMAVLGIWFSKSILGIFFALVAGIMVYISLDELLPAAREYGKGHLAIYGTLAGMAAMAASLWLLRT